MNCPDCGSEKVGEEITTQSFPYGLGDEKVLLFATMPVLVCLECGSRTFDHRGELARAKAVTEHLQEVMLNP